jgi:hypothetical protein
MMPSKKKFFYVDATKNGSKDNLPFTPEFINTPISQQMGIPVTQTGNTLFAQAPIESNIPIKKETPLPQPVVNSINGEKKHFTDRNWFKWIIGVLTFVSAVILVRKLILKK